MITLEEILKELRVTYPLVRHLSYKHNGTDVWEFWLDEYRLFISRAEFRVVQPDDPINIDKMTRWHYTSDPIVLFYHKHVRNKKIEEVVNTILEKLNSTKKVTYEN